ncbi:hypothetical protein OROMI_007652 [Orobanche minor]
MGFYSYLREEDDEPLSPEEKAEYVSLLWNKCLSHSPSLMFKVAEVHDVLPDLVKKAGCIDDDKSKYILISFKLISELEQLVAHDDGVKFSHFLTANRNFVMSFPLPELFHLLCWWGPAPDCVKSLLESSFAGHVDVNRFTLDRTSTPLLAAAKHLCLPLTQTLLQFGADVHHTHPTLSTPLATAITSLRYDKLKMNRSNEQNITSFFYKLSYTNLNEAIDTIHLLASASLTDLNRMLKPIVYDPDWVNLTLLLVIALPLLLCPPIDAWSIDNTPVSRFLSSLSSYGPAQGRRLNEARTVVTSVWEASQNLCKMHFIVRLIPSSGVEEPFPRVMRDYFKQYIDAHSFEAHTPRKRAKYEP